MKRLGLAAVAVALASTAAFAEVHRRSVETAAPLRFEHFENLDWQDAPPILKRGSQLAFVDGSPTDPRGHTFVFYMPEGYEVAAHWHSADEEGFVLHGTVRFGGAAGETIAVREHGFFVTPARQAHRVKCVSVGGCLLSVRGDGPFELIYVDPSSDPQHGGKQRTSPERR